MAAFEIDPEDLAELWESAGPWIEAEEAAAILGVPEAELEAQRLLCRILGCEFPGQSWLYPAKQFSEGGALDRLQGVIAVLRDGGADDYRIADWLAARTSLTDRSRTVWDELKEDPDRALRTARQDADRWKVRRTWEAHPPPPTPD